MRLIDADALISDIEHYNLSDGKFQHWVEIQPTIEPFPQWIPCSERLPDKTGRYICTCSDGTPYQKVTVIKFHPRTKAWELAGTRAYWKVRAWMPLPEPWEGDKE